MVQGCILCWRGNERGLLDLSDAEQQRAELRPFDDGHQQREFHGLDKQPAILGRNGSNELAYSCWGLCRFTRAYGTYDEGATSSSGTSPLIPESAAVSTAAVSQAAMAVLCRAAAGYVEPSFSDEAPGFRAALVPEPGSLPLLVLLTIGLLLLAIAFSPPWRASKTKICHARIKGQRHRLSPPTI